MLENEIDVMFTEIESRLFPAQTYKSLLPALPSKELNAPKLPEKKEQVHSPLYCQFLSLTLSVSVSIYATKPDNYFYDFFKPNL